MLYYQHTQHVPNKAIMAAGLAAWALGFAPPGILAKVLVWGILVSVASTFHSLTVEVGEGEVRLRFGRGLVQKTFLLEEVCSVRAMSTSPLQGWGIHWIGKGWLYNIYGLDAIELKFHSGKHVYIGTDEPASLVVVISQRLKSIQESTT